MDKDNDLPSDSDVSDDDYNPEADNSEKGSEVDSSDDLGEESYEDHQEKNIKTGKRKCQHKKKTTKRKKRKILSEEVVNICVDNTKDQNINEKETTEEDERKRADALWADFLNDTDKPQAVKVENTKTTSTSKLSPAIREEKVINKESSSSKTEKIKVTEIFEFAGEEVEVEKEINIPEMSGKSIGSKSSAVTGTSPLIASRNRGGLGAVLGAIGKKSKISTLEKSKLDWDKFKSKEGINEDIQSFNRGKDGYLQRQDFLERTDLRQFEIEKNLRQTKRSNR